jgi:hypothetical protein
MPEINISGLAPETIESMQPQLAPHAGLDKALAIIDRANAMKKMAASKEDRFEKHYKKIRTIAGPVIKGGGTALLLSKVLSGGKDLKPWQLRSVAATGGAVVAGDAALMNRMKKRKRDARKLQKTGMATPAETLKATQQVGKVGSHTTSKAPSLKAQTAMPPKLGSAMPKIKLAYLGEEEIARASHMVLSRETARAQADAMFDNSTGNRERDAKLLKKLFVQTPGAQSQSTAVKTASAPNVDRALEKIAHDMTLTEAQRRYPELLEVRRS